MAFLILSNMKYTEAVEYLKYSYCLTKVDLKKINRVISPSLKRCSQVEIKQILSSFNLLSSHFK